MIGDSAGPNNTTGYGKSVLGSNAMLSNTTGYYNTSLGFQSDITGNPTNATAIGYNATALASNTMILGDNSVGAYATWVGIGFNSGSPAPANSLEINARTLLGAIAPCSSGLRFTQLTTTCTPVTNPGPGYLALDASGDVIYVDTALASGIGIGYCGTPCGSGTGLTAMTGSGGYNLATNNFYFDGNGSGFSAQNDVAIGNGCCYTPIAKLDVLQASGANSSIGLSVLNTDPGACTAPVIGIASEVSHFSSSTPHEIKIAGYFDAPPSASCCNPSNLQYAIAVPDNGGIVSIGYPILLCPSAGPFATLQVNGTTWCTSSWSSSDSTLKTNVNPINNALAIINQMQGVSFNYIPSVITDTFVSGTHYGFIAQKLARVLPNVVRTGSNGIEGVGYNEITPWLVEGMKEQQQTIDSLRSVLSSIQTCLDSLCNSHSEHHRNGNQSSGDNNPASGETNVQNVTLSGLADAPLLYQNIPNPFSTGTKINYYLPQGTTGATIVFYDSYGNQIKQLQLSQTGNGTLNITPDNLTNGIYSYSLIVNGTVIDTKRMVLQK